METLCKNIVCFLALCCAVPAWAGSIAEYSANLVDVQNGHVMQKIAVMPDKMYSESFNAQGTREGMALVRLDQHKMYIFNEANKSYMEFPFNKNKFTPADLAMGMVDIKQEKVGTETVNGYTATKYRITTKVMNKTITAFQWIAPEFDPMPIRTESEGVIHEMRDIKTGRPDASLFEVPKGYTHDKTMEDMMKGMMKGRTGKK
ncbi:MAG: DUF4412 domain-containing protein [Desulfobulbus sp.]|nr:DUF4412 domain-containing protein [Desulfobulbus sp.]